MLSARQGLDVAADETSVAADGRPARRPAATGFLRRSARLAELAEQVRRLCARNIRSLPRCHSGIATLDTALEGGFARGAIHELLAAGGSAAVRSIALFVAAHAADGQRSIVYLDTTHDLYPPGVAQLGVPLERLMVIRPSHSADALWVCEQSLRCSSVAAAILPLRSLDARISRRLQLAAETGGNLGLLLRSDASGGPTFAASRLRFEPLPGVGEGRRLLVSVLKLREGRLPQPFELELPDAHAFAQVRTPSRRQRRRVPLP